MAYSTSTFTPHTTPSSLASYNGARYVLPRHVPQGISSISSLSSAPPYPYFNDALMTSSWGFDASYIIESPFSREPSVKLNLAGFDLEVRVKYPKILFQSQGVESQLHLENYFRKYFAGIVTKSEKRGEVVWKLHLDDYPKFRKKVEKASELALRQLPQLRSYPLLPLHLSSSYNNVNYVLPAARSESRVSSAPPLSSTVSPIYTAANLSTTPSIAQRAIPNIGVLPSLSPADMVKEQQQLQRQPHIKNALSQLSSSFELDLELTVNSSKILITSASSEGLKRCELFFAVFAGIVTKITPDRKVMWELELSQQDNFITRLKELKEDENKLPEMAPKTWIGFLQVVEKTSLVDLIAELNQQKHCAKAFKPQVLEHANYIDIFLSSEQDYFPLLIKAKTKNMGEELASIARNVPYRNGIRLTYAQLFELLKNED